MALVFNSWWLDLIGIGCGLLLLLYSYFRYSHSYWKTRGVPYMKPSMPFGSARDIVFRRKTFGEIFAEAYNHLPNEKLVGIYIMVHPAIVLRDLDTIKNFLVKDFANFHDRGIRFDPEVDPINGHLFLLSGQKWKNLRAKLTPTFTSGKMKMMFTTLLACAEELKEHLDESAHLGEVVEIKEILARFTTDVISSCAFGIQGNCLKDPDAEFRRYSIKLINPSFKTVIGGLLSFIAPSLASVLKIPTLDADVNDFFFKVVRETIEYREKNGVERNDFIQLLMRLKNTGYVDLDSGAQAQKGVEKLTMDEITANVFIFFIAGFDTSSAAMSFCLYELAFNPSIQDRLRQEVDSTLKKHGELTYEAMHDMPYLDKVVSETLRKYPPVMLLNRQCTKKYSMPDSEVVIEQGVNVIVPVMAIHHDPQYYPDPQVFDPERFSEEAKNRRPHYSYLPFGEGPRACIGLRFGLMQTKVGLISLLSNFEFNVCEKTASTFVMDPISFVMSPIGGIFLRIIKRTDK